MLWKGFKFGILLQFAVGPMCLMVFNTATTYGLVMGITLVIAIALIDTLYITLSGLGASVIINRDNTKKVVKILGALVLVLFGVNTMVSIFNYSILPSIHLFTQDNHQGIFLQGLLLTASNPLTIIFWSGVFGSQVIENNLDKKQLFLFGVGCVISTLVFLTAVAILGSILKNFLPKIVIQTLNGIVGGVLIYFGIKLLLKRDKN